MDSFDSDRYLIFDFSCSQDGECVLVSPVEISTSQLFGYSVQMLDSIDSGYLGLQVANQGAPQRTINDSSIFYSPSIEILLPSPELTTQKYPDEIIPEYFSDESESVGNVPFPDSAATDSQQAVQPPCSTATVVALNRDARHQLATDTVTTIATESFRSDVPLAPAKTCISRESKACEGTCVTSEKSRSRRVRYIASGKGKIARARYLASGKGKIARARYLASDKARKSRAKSGAKHFAFDEGRLMPITSYARIKAYRKALQKGFSKDLAKEKGQIAADKKRAELLSASSPGASVTTPEK